MRQTRLIPIDTHFVWNAGRDVSCPAIRKHDGPLETFMDSTSCDEHEKPAMIGQNKTGLFFCDAELARRSSARKTIVGVSVGVARDRQR